jgi:hypothetical protein
VVITVLTMHTVFGLALRRTEGPIGTSVDLLGLALVVPDQSTKRRGRRCWKARQAGGAEPARYICW